MGDVGEVGDVGVHTCVPPNKMVTELPGGQHRTPLRRYGVGVLGSQAGEEAGEVGDVGEMGGDSGLEQVPYSVLPPGQMHMPVPGSGVPPDAVQGSGDVGEVGDVGDVGDGLLGGLLGAQLPFASIWLPAVQQAPLTKPTVPLGQHVPVASENPLLQGTQAPLTSWSPGGQARQLPVAGSYPLGHEHTPPMTVSLARQQLPDASVMPLGQEEHVPLFIWLPVGQQAWLPLELV